jgi:orotidine-5'-phosphate decarboxylase
MQAVKDLQRIQQSNRSMICLGLDLDPRKMPQDYAGSLKGMFEFAHRIIDATSDQVCAYKPNLAFYESLGSEGMSLLKLIRERIPENIPVIMDGKRNDIGNTAQQYASALFDGLNANWITANPYMGHDSLRPFLERKDRGVFVLCLTSNPGSKDFQQLRVEGRPLYEHVVEKVSYWNKDRNCGLVVGATHPEQLRDIRAKAGEMPILIPGVGAQGGSLEEAVVAGTDHFNKPAVINVSRSVLYASNGPDFAQRARQELMKLNGIVTRVRSGEYQKTEQRDDRPAPQAQAPAQPQQQTPPPQPESERQPETQQQTPPPPPEPAERAEPQQPSQPEPRPQEPEPQSQPQSEEPTETPSPEPPQPSVDQSPAAPVETPKPVEPPPQHGYDRSDDERSEDRDDHRPPSNGHHHQ